MVSGSGAWDPTIQVSANHDYLLLQLRIGTGDLGDCVITRLVIARELRFDIEADRNRHLVLQKTRNSPKSFIRHNCRGYRLFVIRQVDKAHHLAIVIFHIPPSPP